MLEVWGWFHETWMTLSFGIGKIFKLVNKVFIFFIWQGNFVTFETISYFSDCSVQILYFLLVKRFYKSSKKIAIQWITLSRLRATGPRPLTSIAISTQGQTYASILTDETIWTIGKTASTVARHNNDCYRLQWFSTNISRCHRPTKVKRSRRFAFGRLKKFGLRCS